MENENSISDELIDAVYSTLPKEYRGQTLDTELNEKMFVPAEVPAIVLER